MISPTIGSEVWSHTPFRYHGGPCTLTRKTGCSQRLKLSTPYIDGTHTDNFVFSLFCLFIIPEKRISILSAKYNMYNFARMHRDEQLNEYRSVIL